MLQHQKTARARAVSRARTRTTRMQKLVLRIGSLGDLPVECGDTATYLLIFGRDLPVPWAEPATYAFSLACDLLPIPG